MFRVVVERFQEDGALRTPGRGGFQKTASCDGLLELFSLRSADVASQSSMLQPVNRGAADTPGVGQARSL